MLAALTMMNFDAFRVDTKLAPLILPSWHHMRMDPQPANKGDEHSKPKPILPTGWPLSKQNTAPNHHPHNSDDQRDAPTGNAFNNHVLWIKRMVTGWRHGVACSLVTKRFRVAWVGRIRIVHRLFEPHHAIRAFRTGFRPSSSASVWLLNAS